MNSRIWTYFAALLLVGLAWPQGEGLGQSPLSDAEEGIPYFLNNFTPDEYGAHHQNWAVAEDHRGVIYVANTHGVLEYDGNSWRFISVGNRAVVRSVDVAADGRVYVGAAGEMGYLAPDSTGTMRYVSLLEKVPAPHRSFGDVWGTHATDQGVYFQSYNMLFRWHEGRMSVLEMENEVLTSFFMRGDLYFWQRGSGVMVTRGDSLAPAAGYGRLADMPVYAMLPIGQEEVLIGTYEDGLFIYEDGRVRELPNDLNSFVSTNKLYDAARISGNMYAFATLDGGVGIIDLETGSTHIIDESTGLQDERAYGVYADSQGGLWVALYNGVTRTVVPSPVMVFDKRRGLKGAAQSLERHDGVLYAASTRGLYRRSRDFATSDSSIQFQRVPDTPRNTHWSLLSVREELLATSNEGVYVITDTGIEILDGELAFDLYQSKRDPRRVFVGLKDGLISLYRSPDGWTKETRIEDLHDEVWSIGQDSSGVVWLGTRYEGIIRVDFSNGFSAKPSIEKFGADAGLPGGAVLVSEMFDQILFTTRAGTYRANRMPDGTIAFALDEKLASVFEGHSRPLSLARQAPGGNVWMVFGEIVEMYRPVENGRYNGKPSRMLTFPNAKILDAYIEDNYVWLSTKDALFRYNPRLDSLIQPASVALVRRVTVQNDSLVFGGTHPKSRGSTANPQSDEASQMLSLAHRNNNLRFTYAAPSHSGASATRYQYKLDGFDTNWSKWTTETMKEYTNLDDGEYRFRVRARTINGVITDEGVFRFQVFPPWYRTWWAYGVYGLLLVGVLYGYGWYRASISAKKLEQERRVTERLKEANAELRRANRLKDEFLANISHELRTPLASILGFADVLNEEIDEPQREFVQLIRESGDRLYKTLDALLDLAKFRAGMVELDYSSVDVVSEVASVLQLLQPKAQEKEIELELVNENASIHADLDTFCLERIMTNLVGNAIKFTEEGGVTISVRGTDDTVEIRVVDTGIGINEDFLPNIFEAFRQESSGLSRSHQGVGLGLAITKRMVDLMDGEIEVDSQKGVGTEFVLTFPRSHAEDAVSTNGVQHEAIPQEAAV